MMEDAEGQVWGAQFYRKKNETRIPEGEQITVFGTNMRLSTLRGKYGEEMTVPMLAVMDII